MKESVIDQLKYYRNNVSGIVNLPEIMKERQVSQFIFSSSCTVFGKPDQLPVDEKNPIKPASSPCGNTNQIGEAIIRDTVASNKPISAISLRYFNTIGTHDTAQIGELPQKLPHNLVLYLLKVANGELPQLAVFGGDYDTPDGSCIRRLCSCSRARQSP